MAFQPRKCPACGEDDWGVGHQCSSKKVAKKAREAIGDDLVIDEKKRRAMTAHLEITKMAAKAVETTPAEDLDNMYLSDRPITARTAKHAKPAREVLAKLENHPMAQQYGNMPVLVRLDDKLLAKLDTMRGDISRQDFIRKLISDA